MCYFSDDGLWLYIYLVIYQQQQHMEVPEARSWAAPVVEVGIVRQGIGGTDRP